MTGIAILLLGIFIGALLGQAHGRAIERDERAARAASMNRHPAGSNVRTITPAQRRAS